MNAAEYAQTITSARDYLFDRIRLALPTECEMEKRFIMPGVVGETEWSGALVNRQTGKIRLFVMLISSLGAADLAKTAGAKNFKPEMKITFELFHNHLQGTDGANSQDEFEADALKLQFAIETNRYLEPNGKIEDYSFNLGKQRSNISLHYGRGDLTVNFREIRY